MRRWPHSVALAGAFLALLVGGAWRASPTHRPAADHGARATAPRAPLYRATLHGRVVSFGLHGFEPDFDPLYAVVLSLTMRDTRPAPLALPPATLLLDLYLERFQPDTTPLLPDLLHLSQTATHLAGFLQGQAALVNQGGQPPRGTPAPANNPLAGVALASGRAPAQVTRQLSLSLVPLAAAIALLLVAGLLLWRPTRRRRPRRSDTI